MQWLEEFSEKYRLQSKFVAGYIGTHGLAHALDNIIEAAELLKTEDHIRIVFAGGGADRSRLEKLVEKRGLSNVVMIPRQPKEQMQKIWSLCDVSLVPLKDTPFFATLIPSKIFESMAMKLPIIISVPEGESTEIIRDTKSGLIVPPEKPDKISEAILKLEKDIDLLIPHQANLRIINAAAERMKLPLEKVVINIDRFANTTAGTIPIALSEAQKQGRLERGDLVLMAAVGGGLTWGSVLYRWAY